MVTRESNKYKSIRRTADLEKNKVNNIWLMSGNSNPMDINKEYRYGTLVMAKYRELLRISAVDNCITSFGVGKERNQQAKQTIATRKGKY